MLMTQKVLNNKSNVSELKRDFDSVDIGVDHNTGLNQRELDTQYQTSHLTKFNKHKVVQIRFIWSLEPQSSATIYN